MAGPLVPGEPVAIGGPRGEGPLAQIIGAGRRAATEPARTPDSDAGGVGEEETRREGTGGVRAGGGGVVVQRNSDVHQGAAGVVLLVGCGRKRDLGRSAARGYDTRGGRTGFE